MPKCGCCSLIESGGGTKMPTVLLIVLIVVLIGALPTWPYSSGWGYYPSGGVGLLLIVLLILLLTGNIGKRAKI
jgi:hypothetical protein